MGGCPAGVGAVDRLRALYDEELSTAGAFSELDIDVSGLPHGSTIKR